MKWVDVSAFVRRKYFLIFILFLILYVCVCVYMNAGTCVSQWMVLDSLELK